MSTPLHLQVVALVALALAPSAWAIGVDRILDLTGFPKENLRFDDGFESEKRAFPGLLWCLDLRDEPGKQTFVHLNIKAVAPITSLSPEGVEVIERLLKKSDGSLGIRRVEFPDGGFGYIGVPAGLGPGGSAVASLIALPKLGIEMAITLGFPNDFDLVQVPGGKVYYEQMMKGNFLLEFSTALVNAIIEDGPKLKFDALDRFRYRGPGERRSQPDSAKSIPQRQNSNP